MRRRTLLASAATALALPLAGCAEPTGGSLSMMPMENDSAIGRQYAGSSEGLSSDRRDLVESAIAGEAPRRTGRSPPYDAPRPLEHDGAVYEIGHEVVDTRQVTRYAIRIDYDPETTPSAVVAYADIPEADRTALEGQVPPGEDPPTGEGFDLDSTYRYPADAESVLLEGEYDGISYEGETYRFEIEPDREVTVETYEYRAKRIADSAAALGRQLREEYLFTLSGLPEEEQRIADEATSIYRPDDGVPEAFRSLSDRIRAHEPVATDDGRGTYLVRYDGGVYWTTLEYPPETES
jgi:hypothetical protein